MILKYIHLIMIYTIIFEPHNLTALIIIAYHKICYKMIWYYKTSYIITLTLSLTIFYISIRLYILIFNLFFKIPITIQRTISTYYPRIPHPGCSKIIVYIIIKCICIRITMWDYFIAHMMMLWKLIFLDIFDDNF